MSNGWITLHRSLLKHWIADKSEYFAAWVKMLLTVNHKPNKVLIDSKLYDCPRGSSLNSLNSWAMVFGGSWSRQKVRTFFKLLESDQMITTMSLGKTTMITICKYDTYQTLQPAANQAESENVTTSQPLANQVVTTTQPQTTMNNNENNEKQKKAPTKSEIHDSAVSSAPFSVAWDDELKNCFYEFAQHRRDMKKYLTENAIKKHFKALEKYSPEVIEAAYDKAIESGWSSVYPEKVKQSQQTLFDDRTKHREPQRKSNLQPPVDEHTQF